MDLFEQFKQADAAKVLSASSSTQAPIFSLKKFEFDKKTRTQESYQKRIIQDVVVSNNVIIIATTNCCVLRWNASEASREPEKIEIPVTVSTVIKSATNATIDAPDSIERVFIDPTANHVIIAMKSMDNYYLHSRSQKPKKLSKLQGVAECVAFDRHNCTESATRSFLVGTSTGVIYEMSIDSSGKEKLCQPVYQLEQPVPISSIYFDYIGTNNAANTNTATSSTFSAAANVDSDARLFVMWSTSSPTRLYHLTGLFSATQSWVFFGWHTKGDIFIYAILPY